MRDRLIEMQRMAGIEQEKRDSGKPLLKSRHDSFEEFLDKIDRLRHALVTLDGDREWIRRMQVDALANGGATPNITKEMNEHVDRFIQRARLLRERFSNFDNELARHLDQNCGSSRARREQVIVLLSNFENLMMKFNEDQVNYKNVASKKIGDYFRKQNIEVSTDQIDEAIESGNLFNLTKNAHLGIEQKKVLFADVKSRADEIMVLERQIREIADLFHDMHLLVVSQGETIDRIDASVSNATDYTGKAAGDVKSAIVMRKRNRKMKICILIVAIVVIVVLLFTLQSLICFYTPIC